MLIIVAKKAKCTGLDQLCLVKVNRVHMRYREHEVLTFSSVQCLEMFPLFRSCFQCLVTFFTLISALLISMNVNTYPVDKTFPLHFYASLSCSFSTFAPFPSSSPSVALTLWPTCTFCSHIKLLPENSSGHLVLCCELFVSLSDDDSANVQQLVDKWRAAGVDDSIEFNFR